MIPPGPSRAEAFGRFRPNPMVSPATTAVVADAHAAVREGLPLLLRDAGVAVLGCASSAATAEALVSRHDPDVVLIAVDLPDMDGLTLLSRFVQRGVRAAVLLYTDTEDAAQAQLAVHAGASGSIAKTRPIGQLADALRTVGAGRVWLAEETPTIVPQVLRAAVDNAPPPERRRTADLSGTELKVLSLIADGQSTEDVAETLSVSPHTVRTHLRNLMRKLDAQSRAHAVAIALREEAFPT